MQATRAIALGLLAALCSLGGCNESALKVTDDRSSKASSSPVPIASAAPGEELGVYLEAIGFDNTSRHFYWPTTAWQPCRALARAKSPAQVGFLEMNLSLDEMGVVTKVDVVGGEGLDAPVAKCITDAARATKFPMPDGGAGSVYGYVTLR